MLGEAVWASLGTVVVVIAFFVDARPLEQTSVPLLRLLPWLSVQLFGPTNFTPTIRFAAENAGTCTQNEQKYSILLILTDGEITDLDMVRGLGETGAGGVIACLPERMPMAW